MFASERFAPKSQPVRQMRRASDSLVVVMVSARDTPGEALSHGLGIVTSVHISTVGFT